MLTGTVDRHKSLVYIIEKAFGIAVAQLQWVN